MSEYKKLGDFDIDFLKSYPKEYYEEIIKQLDPNDLLTKVLEVGVKIVFETERLDV